MLNYRKDQEKQGFLKFIGYLRKNILAVAIVVVVIAGLISTLFIYLSRNSEKNEDEKNIVYEEASTIFLPMKLRTSFNPLTEKSKDIDNMNQLLFNSLFKQDRSLNVEKDLVKDYKTDKDKGYVDITLADNHKFSDGSAVNAYDVSFTINRIKKIGARSMYFNYVNRIERMVINSSYNFRIYFKDKYDASLTNLVFPIVSSDKYNESQEYSMGSGKYKVDKVISGQKIILSANEKSPDKPSNNIEIELLDDISFDLGLMTMDAVTATIVNKSNGDMLAKSKNLKYKPITSGELEYIGFNFSNPLLKKKKIRKAIAYCINNKEIIQDNYGNSAKETDSIYSPNFLDAPKDKEAVKYDPQKAAKLIKEAGIEKNDDGNNQNNNASLRIIVNGTDVSRKDTAQSISEYMDKVGLKSTVEVLNESDYLSRLKKKDFDIYVGGISVDKQYRFKDILGEDNYINFNNKKIIEQVRDMEQCLDPEERMNLFSKLKKNLNDFLPYYPICYKNYYFISVKTLEYKDLPTFYNYYNGIENWTWEKKKLLEKKQ